MKYTERFIHEPFPRDMPFRGEARFLKMRGFTLKLVEWDDMTALEAYTFIGAEEPVITVYSYDFCDMINIKRGNRCWHCPRPTASEVITELINCAKQYEKYIS